MKSFIKKYAAVAALMVFASTFVVDAYFVAQENSIKTDKKTCTENGRQADIKNIPRISEIRGSMIDSEAASISCETKTQSREVLPPGGWIFLLLSYIGLLIFNLSFGFKQSKNIRWVWETILTGIYVFGWAYFDKSGQAVWFPLYVIKSGIIIYFFYLYFFQKKEEKVFDI